MNIFKDLIKNPDLSLKFVDGSFVKAHQHCAGAARTENQDIGKSKGGNTTKIHTTVDTNGMPIEFCLSPDFITKSLKVA